MLKWTLFFIVGSLLTVSSKQTIDESKDDTSSSESERSGPAHAPTDTSPQESSSSSSVSEEDSSSSTSNSENDLYDMSNKAKCFGKNEVYVTCPSPCGVKTCENLLHPPRHCIRQPHLCRPSCQCKPNTYRNFKGECISREDCLKCQGPNEYFSCGVACDNECARMSKQNQTSCPIVTKQCTKRCYCKPGYARDVDGRCIHISACPAQCKDNEEYVKNTKAINRSRTCSEFLLGLMPYQIDHEVVPGCACIPGYVKNHKDICIPQKECYADIIHGDLLDTNLTEIIAITTLTILVPSAPVCGPNEVMSNCINSGCVKHNCTQLGRLDTCVYIPPELCKRGCQCKEGYLRDVSGKCISKAECPQRACNGINEIYVECPNRCVTERCNSFNMKIVCPPPKVCEPSCRCKPNTCRNGENVCVPKIICKENERYLRNVNALKGPKTCKDTILREESLKINNNRNQSPFYPYNPGCVCIHGYVRNEHNICIPIKDCPPPCGANAEYVNDTSKICRPMECSELGYELNCFKSQNHHGIPGCVCKDGFVKDVHGHCMPKSHCSSCGGDPNARAGCGVFCDTCESYKNTHKQCPKICIPNGCQCKTGYVYNTQTSKCVSPEECGDDNQILMINPVSDALI